MLARFVHRSSLSDSRNNNFFAKGCKRGWFKSGGIRSPRIRQHRRSRRSAGLSEEQEVASRCPGEPRSRPRQEDEQEVWGQGLFHLRRLRPLPEPPWGGRRFHRVGEWRSC